MNNNEKDIHDYDDIINLPRHVSTKHPQMTARERAAQFSPFAALTGYDAAIKETARLTSERAELSEDALAALNDRFRLLAELPDDSREVTICRFRPDLRKSGGSYETVVGAIKRVDEYERVILMRNGEKIPMDDVYTLEGEMFGGLAFNREFSDKNPFL